MSSFRVVAKSMYLVLRKWINLLLHPSKIGKLYFSYIEIPVTTNCTLRCENCANLMQYYEPQPFIDAKTILSDIDKLLQSVGIIDTFGVLGGEPLLYPNLFEVMEKLINSDQIRAVRLVTNGTLFPNDQLISLLKNKKVTVMLSDYGSLSKEKKNISKIPGVHCRIKKVIDYGVILETLPDVIVRNVNLENNIKSVILIVTLFITEIYIDVQGPVMALIWEEFLCRIVK